MLMGMIQVELTIILMTIAVVVDQKLGSDACETQDLPLMIQPSWTKNRFRLTMVLVQSKRMQRWMMRWKMQCAVDEWIECR